MFEELLDALPIAVGIVIVVSLVEMGLKTIFAKQIANIRRGIKKEVVGTSFDSGTDPE